MNLDDGELEIALMALQHFRADATGQAEGTGNYPRAYGAAWRCCKHVAAKADLLIDRINQHQQDRRNGDA